VNMKGKKWTTKLKKQLKLWVCLQGQKVRPRTSHKHY